MRNFSLSPAMPGIAPLGAPLAAPLAAPGGAVFAGEAARLPGAVVRPFGPASESFGRRLARLRKARRLTQADLAQRAGVSEASVCYWEQDRSRPKAARLQALAGLLDIAVADLLGADAPERPNLGDMVARVRAEIAEAAGTTPSKVRIVIEM